MQSPESTPQMSMGTLLFLPLGSVWRFSPDMSVLSLIQQAWNSDDYQVQLCMVALGWILLNILLILLAWRRHGSSISDMFRRQGTSASCKNRLSPVLNKRPTWQDKSHLNGTNFNSSTGLPNGNGLPNGSHLPNGRLHTVSEKSHQS
ncbi:T-cell leukemia translocation-altered gene protein homolog isoform X5 [Branchiostoma floridae x Branchiostoma japonicum]